MSQSYKNKYRTLFEHSITACLILSEDEKILDANPAAYTLFKYSHQELTNKSLVDILDISKGVNSNEPIKTEGVCKDNSRIICTCKRSDIALDANQKGILLQISDSTDETETKDRLHGLTDNIPGVVFRFRINGKGTSEIINISEGAEIIWGISADEVLQDNSVIYERYPEDDLKTHKESIYASMKSMSSWMDEWRYNHPDGTLRWHRGVGNPKKSPDGSVVWDVIVMDITMEKEETHRMSMLESVVTNANDSVLITTCSPIEAPDGPEVIYVNRAFTEMTGYRSDEIIGKTPRILQGPNSEGDGLQKLRMAIANEESAEVELINYKKNGEEFWVHISFSPVYDNDGECSHFIAIERDITERKNRELLNTLQADVNRQFNTHDSLTDTFDAVLDTIISFGNFKIAEIWLLNENGTSIDLQGCRRSESDAARFYEESKWNRSFRKGEGMPGTTWQTGETQFWRNLGENEKFVRCNAAKITDIQTAYCIPVTHDRKIIGALLLGLREDQPRERYYLSLLKELGHDLGSEIKRKQLEQQLSRIFSFSPDIICVAGMDGYYKRVNPAMSRMLGYTQDELLSHPITSFTHPDDRLRTEKEVDALATGKGQTNFENRLITKSGEVVWVSWTTRTFEEEGKVYSIARDITEQKKLELLLEQASSLSKIGGWEVDQANKTVYWSDITYEIHEVSHEFEPDLQNAIHFYKEGKSRAALSEALNGLMNSGKPFDIEAQIITGKGNEKWVRVIGEAEILEGRFKRLYGSFQDVDQLKRAEIASKKAAEQRANILESISDAFYAIDDQWNITYFNKEAENLLNKSADDLKGKNFWDVFPEAKETELYQKYRVVVENGEPETFEYYYPPEESWFETSAYPAEDGITVYFKQIDERKEWQQRILNKTRQLDTIALFNGLLIKKESWKDALFECMEKFADVVDADRVYYFKNEQDENSGDLFAKLELEWASEKWPCDTVESKIRELPLSQLDQFVQVLSENNPLSVRVADVSNEELKGAIEAQNVKSILMIPVFTGGVFYGVISFEDCESERVWNEEEISFLQTIAINLASAIEGKQAEHAIQQAYEERNRLLESIGDAFFAVNREWTVTYWNNEAEKVLQMPRENVVGKNLWDIYKDATELDFYYEYHRVMNEQCSATFEEYYPTLDKWFEVSAYPSPDGVSVFFKDISDRKEWEERLKKLNRDLEQKSKDLEVSNAELEQFAFVASHDLQEPLRMITSFLSLLDKKYGENLDDKAKEYIYFASDGARRMRQIILDLLDFSRIGRVENEKRIVDLNEVVEVTKLLNKQTIEEKKGEIIANDLPKIVAEEPSIKRLLANLVNNALKYQKEGVPPRIIITAEEQPNQWVMRVEDNGIGINKEYSQKIFNIFQRLHPKEEYPGTGIGLAICKKIVEQHGGDIWVESEDGKGSVFSFSLPKVSLGENLSNDDLK
ncbi:PAS domain S-box protein [Rhodohalobacter sp. SW132]|uniref:PAS domain S-box protein n=1 Tax=Rhodohalobacter sp. SW132 TaxID=2293433 RepID=UPI000E27EB83|nr:PAS domain S-box protein [Rhodohalobacter sp. SW132]REL29128.1 PAS domain S-box protein [Rhodohalobacter sp. SW132]